MRDIKIVIGANYGDEGKGLMTDYFSAQTVNGKVLVIRHSGGAQAGHTVVNADGGRHVFHHIGAGTFAGADTYLSKYFLVNPILFLQEYEALASLDRKIWINAAAMITTPYDMIYNQMLEDLRDNERHGSCGAGVAATMERGKAALDFQLKVCHIGHGGQAYIEKVKHIRDMYYRDLFTKTLHGFETAGHLKDKYLGYLDSAELLENFVDDSYLFFSKVGQLSENADLMTERQLLECYDRLVFEGSQGLLLDQNHVNYPYVTYANTGIRNADEMLGANLLDKSGAVEIVYVTRCYLTRHGAGPLPNELFEKPYTKVEDLTNLPNKYQGALRFAYLNLDLLKEAIANDISKSSIRNYSISLAITCIDQLDGELFYYHKGCLHKKPVDKAIEAIYKIMGINRGYLSYGPSRKDVVAVSC